MSVLIKGMEMPERCGRCHFVRWSNLHQTAWCKLAQEACFENFSNDYKNRRADFCPLVEVPTPHGRLIDADALHDAMYHRAFETDGDTMWQSGCWVRFRAIEQVHESQPTIIDAEGSEE